MKKTSMHKLLAALLVAGAATASPITAQVTFTDDFDRAEIGSDWTIHQGNWWVENSQLQSGNTATENVISFNGFDLVDTPSFTYETNMAHLRSAGWAGIAFHVNDASNFYMLRVRPDQNRVQFIAFVNGTNNVLLNSDTAMSPAFEVGDTYLFGVDSPVPGQFDVYIRDDQGTLIFNASRTNTLLSGGEAGYYSGSTGGADVLNMTANDFSLTVVPEPATTGMMAGALMFGAALWWRRGRR